MAGGIGSVCPPATSLRICGFGVPGHLPAYHRDGMGGFSLWVRKEPPAPCMAGVSLPAVLSGIQAANATTAAPRFNVMAAPRLYRHLLPDHSSVFSSCFASSCRLPQPRPQPGRCSLVLPALWQWWHAVPSAVTSHLHSLWRRAPYQAVRTAFARRAAPLPARGGARCPAPLPGAPTGILIHHLRVLWGGMVLGLAKTLLLWEAPMRVATPGGWQCCSRRPNLAGIFADIQRHPQVARGILQEDPAPRLQPEPQSPEVPPALVTPVDLQPFLEAFSTQSISKDPSCGSKRDAPSPPPAGPVSPNLFSDITRDKLLDHARASRQDRVPAAEPCDHREVSKVQGSGCTRLLKITGQLVLKPWGWRGEERGGGWGGWAGRRGTSVSLEEGGQGY